MKNLLSALLFCTVVLLVPELHAQFSIGLETGYTRAWEDYGDEVDLPEDAEIHVNGFNISAMAYYDINRFLQVGAEPGFVERGAACIPGFEIFTGETKFFLNYIEMPVMLRAHTAVWDRVALTAKVGYGPSMMVSAVMERTSLWSNPTTQRTRMDIGSDPGMNRWDHGFTGGLSLGYLTPRGEIFLQGEYNMGLRNAEPSIVSKGRNVNLNVGYLARL